MKTRIKKRYNRYYPEYTKWYWFFWHYFEYEYGDDCLIGLGPTAHRFKTPEEAEQFLKENT